MSYPGITEDNDHRVKADESESDILLLLCVTATLMKKKSITGNQGTRYIYIVKCWGIFYILVSVKALKQYPKAKCNFTP
jgi:hypothetical protein